MATAKNRSMISFTSMYAWLVGQDPYVELFMGLLPNPTGKIRAMTQ
jgi:hypothetical protein